MEERGAPWYLIQYTADLARREPRNVGVMLRTDEGWLSRFYGFDGDALDGRRIRSLGLKKAPYEAWVSYFRRKTSEDAWADVERAQNRRRGNFAATQGGVIAGKPASWSQELDRIFAEVVAEPAKASLSGGKGGELRRRAAEVLRTAGVVPEHRVTAPADFGTGTHVEVIFDFGYVNGQKHLMDAVAVGGPSGVDRAQAFNARVNAAMKANAAKSFLSFYASDDIDASHESPILAALEGVAHTVDLADPKRAAATVSEIMNH